MALLGLLLLVVGASLPGADALRILIVHPLYAGSHALTLQVWKKKRAFIAISYKFPFQSVTGELLKNGHSVTTVKFRDTNLPPLPISGHPNFTLVSE